MVDNKLVVGGGYLSSSQCKPGFIRRIKNLVKSNPIGRWLLARRKAKRDAKADKLREPYIPEIKRLIDSNTSIISSNCFAGRIMQDIGMQYNTPTLGLYFFTEDYIELLSNLKYYMKEAKIEFLEESRYPLANERRANWEHWYPIGLLGGKVEIQFLHYHTEEEAAEKWYRRAGRINWDNLLVIGFEQNLCTGKQIREFDSLPYSRKFFFSSKNIADCRSNIYMPEFTSKGEVGDPYLKAYLYYENLIERLK